MARLDRPVRIWLATVTVVTPDVESFDRYTWADPIDAWADITDGGSTFDPLQTGASRTRYLLNFIVRWTREIAGHELGLMAIQIKGDTGDPPQGSDRNINFGGAWIVYERSILEQADRRRFLGLAALRTNPLAI